MNIVASQGDTTHCRQQANAMRSGKATWRAAVMHMWPKTIVVRNSPAAGHPDNGTPISHSSAIIARLPLRRFAHSRFESSMNRRAVGSCVEYMFRGLLGGSGVPQFDVVQC